MGEVLHVNFSEQVASTPSIQEERLSKGDNHLVPRIGPLLDNPEVQRAIKGRVIILLSSLDDLRQFREELVQKNRLDLWLELGRDRDVLDAVTKMGTEISVEYQIKLQQLFAS